MTDPFRLRVLKALSSIFEEITPANGYQSDLSGAVFRGRTQFGVSDPIPMLCILEDKGFALTAPAGGASALTKTDWPLIVQGFAKDDRDHPTDPAHALSADVQKRIGLLRSQGYSALLDFTGPNRIHEVRFGSPIVRPPEDGVSDKAFFWLRLTLTIVEDLANPYT